MYAKFRENKTSRNGKITLSFIDIGKSCLSRELFVSLIYLSMLFAKIKFPRKFPNLQYLAINLKVSVFVALQRHTGFKHCFETQHGVQWKL